MRGFGVERFSTVCDIRVAGLWLGHEGKLEVEGPGGCAACVDVAGSSMEGCREGEEADFICVMGFAGAIANFDQRLTLSFEADLNSGVIVVDGSSGCYGAGNRVAGVKDFALAEVGDCEIQ